MNADQHIILVFDSIHDVMRAEKIIKAQDIWCDLVPTPRELSSDCGMSIECRESDLSKLGALKKSELLKWKSRHF